MKKVYMKEKWSGNMENNRKEQLEALKVLGDFQDKIIGNAGLLMNELKICRKPDTDKLLKSVTDAVNWEMSILSNTLDLINEKEEVLNKTGINESVMAFAGALQSQDDAKIAEALEQHLLPALQKIEDAIRAVRE